MATRRSRRKSKYGRKKSIGVGGWFGILIGLFGLVFVVALGGASFLFKPVEINQTTLCPVDTEVAGSVAILIDNTDKIPDRSSRQAQVHLAKQIDALPENTLVSVFVMSENSSSHITPLISRCKPSDGKAVSRMTKNPALMKKRFEEEFYTPLFEALNGLFDKEPSSYSPILESLQSISIESFQPYSEDVSKRLLVISDLLQHSVSYSMYSDRPDYSEYSTAAKTTGQNTLSLRGVEVEFLVLPREIPVGTRADVVDFWLSLIVDKGATLGSSMTPM